MQDLELKAQDLYHKMQVIEQARHDAVFQSAKSGKGRFSDLAFKDKEYMKMAETRINLGLFLKHPNEPQAQALLTAYTPIAEEFISKYL